jgi:primase-polymerase (primpol)-like protein
MSNADVIRCVFLAYLLERRWVEWRFINNNKVPYIPGTDRRARVNDSKTWGAYNECRSDKIGIVFMGDGLGGVDLDGCRDPKTGEIAAWALTIIQQFNSYAEISPSGTGVKIFACGAPAKLAIGVRKMLGESINGKAPQMEAYVTGRFFTVTGERL